LAERFLGGEATKNSKKDQNIALLSFFQGREEATKKRPKISKKD